MLGWNGNSSSEYNEVHRHGNEAAALGAYKEPTAFKKAAKHTQSSFDKTGLIKTDSSYLPERAKYPDRASHCKPQLAIQQERILALQWFASRGVKQGIFTSTGDILILRMRHLPRECSNTLLFLLVCLVMLCFMDKEWFLTLELLIDFARCKGAFPIRCPSLMRNQTWGERLSYLTF